MNIFDDKGANFWRNIATHSLLVIVTTLIIVWFFPRNNGPHYIYEVGKPWMYGSLMAKFDFPIYKDDATISKEQDSIMTLYEPYYNYDADVEKKEVDRFINDYKTGIEGLPKSFIYNIADRLHDIYQQGVMQSAEYGELYKDTMSNIRVVTGKEAKSINITQVYSTVRAYEQLFLDPAIAEQRTLLQKCNLNNYIEPNLIYDEEKSETSKKDLTESIPLASGVVLSGQKIIDRGEIVNQHTFRVLESLKKENDKRTGSKRDYWITFGGQALYVFMLVLALTAFLVLFRKDYLSKPRSMMMIYSLVVIFPVLVSLMVSHNFFTVYILPFAMVPIFIRIFMDSRTAFMAHIIMVLICACVVRYQYEFIIIQSAAGLVAIYSLRELSKRSQLFRTALLVTLASALFCFALDLIKDSDLSKIDRSIYSYLVINGFFLLFAYPLMLIVEKAFGFTSNVTLIELSNSNNELLRRMSEVAPGTFQHSIQVGNLAAAVANKIDAQSQLVRTGALYHDIGKTINAPFFTENQSGVNPHDKMTDIESAKIVISHVTEGLKLAEKHNLPNIIKDFISTHHGTGITKYFYINYKNEHPDEEVDKSLFQYPGPNPFTREQAILMMADTVEAASRSLKEYTEESISELVNKLIDSQVNDGFFKECPITFRDIAIAKQVFIEKLKTIYHTRISYPELSKEAQENETKEKEKQENTEPDKNEGETAQKD